MNYLVPTLFVVLVLGVIFAISESIELDRCLEEIDADPCQVMGYWE